MNEEGITSQGPDFDRALEWIRRRFPTWPGHIEQAAYLERLIIEVRSETIEACCKVIEDHEESTKRFRHESFAWLTRRLRKLATPIRSEGES